MRMTRLAAALLLALTTGGCGLLASLQPPVVAKSDVARAAADPAAAIDTAARVNAFGFDFYRALIAADPAANAVVSPASVAIALAMARGGARGETATQMDAVMHSLGSDEMAAGMNALDQALRSRSATYGRYDVTLTMANAPFAQRDEAWEQSYLDALAERFGAGIRLVDYRTNTEGARLQINDWVSEQTAARIPELLASGTLDELTRLVLVNAIYVNAPWEREFDAAVTRPGGFTRLDGSTVEAQMMAIGGSFAHAEGAGWKAVELPYVGRKLALTVILPDDFPTYVAALDGDAFAEVTDSLATAGEVELTMPRFSTETKADLATVLAGLGMPLAFDPLRADFTGMTTQEPLFIKNVIHQANVSVDEQGTEASAATGVVVEAGAAPEGPFVIRLDRPFVFALRDLETGAILFLGQMVDPTAG